MPFFIMLPAMGWLARLAAGDADADNSAGAMPASDARLAATQCHDGLRPPSAG